MVNDSTTRSTLTRNVGRSCATASATNKKIRPIRRSTVLFLPDSFSLFRLLVLRNHLFARLLPNFIAYQAERAQQRRPVFEMRGENALHGLLGPFGHTQIQLRRTHVDFI